MNTEDPIRALLDSNAIDLLPAKPGEYELLQDAVAAGSLDLMWTHITIDELAAIPDLERRAHLLCLGAGIARLVATGAAVYDYSRYNFARYGSEDDEALEAYRQGNLKHTNDALIASTAQFEDCYLVSQDEQLRSRAHRRDIPVLYTHELLDLVRQRFADIDNAETD